jgi:hypothetical protein
MRAAVLRAMWAARTYLDEGGNISLVEAAARHGACVRYVRACVTLVKSGDQRLIHEAMTGITPLLAAAESVAPLVMLITSYEKASPYVKDASFSVTGCTSDLGKHLAASSAAERTAGAVKFGDAEALWDQMVMPLVRAVE